MSKYKPQTKAEVLAELKKKDSHNLLDVKKRVIRGNDDVLVANFEDINGFIDNMGIEPSSDSKDPIEFGLFSRLLAIRFDDAKVNILLKYDRHRLLDSTPNSKSTKPDTVIATPPPNKLGIADKLGLLNLKGKSIFEIKHVPLIKDKITTMPKEVAKRAKCKEFSLFEPLFDECQKDIQSGVRKVVEFKNEQDITQGSFFIYGGIKCYVASVGERLIVNGRNNARLRLIFDNGLESNMLQRSLSAELYKPHNAGRRILSPNTEEEIVPILEHETMGYLYILRSLSTNPDLKLIPNLFKIGLTEGLVEDRIRNAKNDPTYLMSEVVIVQKYRVANITPNFFETVLHRLFDNVRLSIEVADRNGIFKQPKEWFSVPYVVIDQAMNLIITGEIVDYVYDSAKLELIYVGED